MSARSSAGPGLWWWPRARRRDVSSEGLDAAALGHAEHGRLFSPKSIILLLQVALLPQCFFPAPFQLARNQAVLRLDGVILPGCSIGLDLGPFQPFLPVLFDSLALAL